MIRKKGHREENLDSEEGKGDERKTEKRKLLDKDEKI